MGPRARTWLFTSGGYLKDQVWLACVNQGKSTTITRFPGQAKWGLAGLAIEMQYRRARHSLILQFVKKEKDAKHRSDIAYEEWVIVLAAERAPTSYQQRPSPFYGS